MDSDLASAHAGETPGGGAVTLVARRSMLRSWQVAGWGFLVVGAGFAGLALVVAGLFVGEPGSLLLAAVVVAPFGALAVLQLAAAAVFLRGVGRLHRLSLVIDHGSVTVSDGTVQRLAGQPAVWAAHLAGSPARGRLLLLAGEDPRPGKWYRVRWMLGQRYYPAEIPIDLLDHPPEQVLSWLGRALDLAWRAGSP